MTKELRRISIVILLMFMSLFAAISWIQVIEAEALGQHEQNRRTLLDSYEIQRGSILAGGTQIASSTPTDDMFSFQRVYVDSAMWAPVTGYYNPALGSATAIERALNSELSGTGGTNFFASIERIISGQPQRGANVVLSLDPAVQQVAYDALVSEGYEGAVIAIEPATGRVLAMVSTPSYDTNLMAVHDADAAEATFAALEDDPTDPLSNRAIAGNMNPPGSTFKIVTVATALASGKYTMDSMMPNPAAYTLPGTSTSVQNAWGGTCGGGATVSIGDALKLSCNIPMAELAVELGDDAILAMAEKFGFNLSFDIPLESTPSSYPRGLDAAQTGLTGFGQGPVIASPLQIAMVSAAVANGGVVMNPRMVDSILGDDLSVLKAFENSEFGRALSADEAKALTQVLVAGVQSGAAQGARIDGVDVAGKTGTAENGDEKPYTLWFTGFAPADNPEVAVAVVVEDGGGKGQSGSGDEIASPIAKKVIEAVLSR